MNTHTDGQNAIEENGAIACIAIARHYASIPQARRPRTLVFSLVTGHMGPNLPQTQGFVDRFPQLVRKAACAITIEHLGAAEWIDDEQGYRATGRPELAAAFHSETPISQYVTRSYKENALTGITLLRPVFDTPIRRFLVRHQAYLAKLLRRSFDTRGLTAYLGVGAPLHQAGVPSIGYLSGPTYLVTVSGNHEMDKFDPERMRLETEWIIKTLHCLEKVSVWKLRRNSSFRHSFALLLAATTLAIIGTYATIEAVNRADHYTAYTLLFVGLGLVCSLAISLVVYAVVRFIGWIILNFTAHHFWRARIKRRLSHIRGANVEPGSNNWTPS